MGKFTGREKHKYKGPKSRRRPTHLRHWEKLRQVQVWGWGSEWMGQEREREGPGLWAEDPGKRNTVITL